MRIPAICGVIDRRILVNFRVDPEVLSTVLPAPFRPQIVSGYGIAGICLIRLKQVRPRWIPPALGIASENAAHRVAVEWNQDDRLRTGVYIARRDTSSRLNCLAGGRLFPGEHHLAHFLVDEIDDRYRVTVDSRDGATHLHVDAALAPDLSRDSVFRSLTEAANFFEQGSLGYSPCSASGEFDGVELQTFNWRVQPLTVDAVESSYFEDCGTFPAGSASFDSALLMRDIRHEWHVRESLCQK